MQEKKDEARVNVRVDPALKQQLLERTKAEGKEITTVVIELIKSYLNTGSTSSEISELRQRLERLERVEAVVLGELSA
ncbi:MAG: hypothetical protein V7L23_18620 [Nostoc sp.]|uniref:hypothetical protein n=1 Tax=Nostoc sp. TaxID=1180 RepID=UPI002FF0EDB2